MSSWKNRFPVSVDFYTIAFLMTKEIRRNAVHSFLILMFYILLYVAFFSPVLLSGRFLTAPYDAVQYFLPNFLRGAKLWDPALLSGFPAAADPQSMVWYPLSFLFSLLHHSWNAYVISAYVLASCFAYGYAFSITGSRLAASASGIIYGMSGFMVAHLGFTSIIHVAAWLPLLLWSLEKLRTRFMPFWFVAGCLAVACSALSGHLQILIYTLGVGFVYAFFRGHSAIGSRLRYFLLAAAVMLSGLILAAVQLLPALELVRLGPRSAMSFADFVSMSLPPYQAINLIFPYLFGGAPASFYKLPYFAMRGLTESSGYIGLLTLMLAAAGLFTLRNNSLARLWAGIGLIAFLLVLGDSTFLAGIMFNVPFFNKCRVPARHFFEVAMALSVLSAFGIKSIQERIVSKKNNIAIVLTGILVVASSLFLIFFFSSNLQTMAGIQGIDSISFMPWSNMAVGVPLIIFTIASLSFLCWSAKPGSMIRKIILIAALIVDLGSFGWFFIWRQSPPQSYFQPPATARTYQPLLAGSHQRMIPIRGVHTKKGGFPPNLSRLWDIQSASGYGPLILSRLAQLLSMSPHGDIYGRWHSPENRSFDIMAIRFAFLDSADARSGTFLDRHKIKWAQDDLEISIGSSRGGHVPPSARITLPVSVRATEIQIVSALSWVPGISDEAETALIKFEDGLGNTRALNMRTGRDSRVTNNAPVVRMLLTDENDNILPLIIRAGRDTSEWAFDCSEVGPKVKHLRAAVFESFSVQLKSELFDGHQFVAHKPLSKPFTVKTIALNWIGEPGGGIGIQKITLVDKESGLSYPISAKHIDLADATHWRSIENIGGGMRIYENLRVMPRAWLVSKVVPATPAEILLALQTSWLPDGSRLDPATTALIEEPIGLEFQEKDPAATVQVVFIKDTSAEIRVVSSASAFLVVSDVYYPGWNAAIDGKSTRIFQANFVLRGIAVPSGSHTVRFEFRPMSLYIGAGLTFAGLCFLVFVVVWSSKRRSVIK
jgi:hypothetical protein